VCFLAVVLEFFVSVGYNAKDPVFLSSYLKNTYLFVSSLRQSDIKPSFPLGGGGGGMYQGSSSSIRSRSSCGGEREGVCLVFTSPQNLDSIIRTGWGKITSLNFKVNNEKIFEIQQFYFWILKLQHGKF